MITNLYIAANAIGDRPHYAHLQIVAKIDGEFFETEVQPSAFFLDWDVYNNSTLKHNDSPDPNVYKSMEIDLSYTLPDGDIQRDPANVWELMLQAYEAVADAWIPYLLLDQNSNSYIRTLFDAVGLDLPSYLGRIRPNASVDGFPGSEDNVANNLTGTIVDFQIRGTLGRDIFFGGQGEDYIGGREGDDLFVDGRGGDVVEGGEGDDRIELETDGVRDIVIVGQGDDTIVGGDENDRLVVRVDQFLAEGGGGLGDSAKGYAIPLLGGFRTGIGLGSEAYGYADAQVRVFTSKPDFDVEVTVGITQGEVVWRPDEVAPPARRT